MISCEIQSANNGNGVWLLIKHDKRIIHRGWYRDGAHATEVRKLFEGKPHLND